MAFGDNHLDRVLVMVRDRLLHVALLAAGVCTLVSGCFSLSLGTRNCTGESPEVKAKISGLDKRITAIEQMLGAESGQMPHPSNTVPTGPTPITIEPLPHGMSAN